jgi:hypothetical protein
VVAVPFPYVERMVQQRRPALVVAAGLGAHDLLWVLMITAAVNPRWPDDVEIIDHEAAGLPIPSNRQDCHHRSSRREQAWKPSTASFRSSRRDVEATPRPTGEIAKGGEVDQESLMLCLLRTAVRWPAIGPEGPRRGLEYQSREQSWTAPALP